MQFFGPKTVPRAPGPKIENFEKKKKIPPGICLIYKCTKFQKILIIKSTACPKVKKHRQTHRHTDTHTLSDSNSTEVENT